MMINKDQILDSMAHEISVIKHLYSKIPSGAWDFKLADNTRTTKALLQYISVCAIVSARGMIKDEFPEVFKRLEKSKELEPEGFLQAMDDQLAELKEVFSEISNDDLANRDVTLPWGSPAKLGDALMNTSLKFLTSYRMMLFLHAKASGATDINTANCWLGLDHMKKSETS